MTLIYHFLSYFQLEKPLEEALWHFECILSLELSENIGGDDSETKKKRKH